MSSMHTPDFSPLRRANSKSPGIPSEDLLFPPGQAEVPLLSGASAEALAGLLGPIDGLFRRGPRLVTVPDLARELVRCIEVANTCVKAPGVTLSTTSPTWVFGVVAEVQHSVWLPGLEGAPEGDVDRFTLDAIRDSAKILRSATSSAVAQNVRSTNPILLRLWSEERGLANLPDEERRTANVAERARIFFALLTALGIEAREQTARKRALYDLIERRPGGLPHDATPEALLALIELRIEAQFKLGWPWLRSRAWSSTVALLTDTPGRQIAIDTLDYLGLMGGLTKDDQTRLGGAPDTPALAQQCLNALNQGYLTEGRKLIIEGNALYLTAPTPSDRAMDKFQSAVQAWTPKALQEKNTRDIGVVFQGPDWERPKAFQLRVLSYLGFTNGIPVPDQKLLMNHPRFDEAVRLGLEKASTALGDAFCYHLNHGPYAQHGTLIIMSKQFQEAHATTAPKVPDTPPTLKPELSFDGPPRNLAWSPPTDGLGVLESAAWSEDGLLFRVEKRRAEPPNLSYLGTVSEEWQPGAVPHTDGDYPTWFIPARTAEMIANSHMSYGLPMAAAFRRGTAEVEADHKRMGAFGQTWTTLVLHLSVWRGEKELAVVTGNWIPSDASEADMTRALCDLVTRGKQSVEAALRSF